MACTVQDDPDDNAGDADTTGDGSACIEDEFIEYNNLEDHGDLPGVMSWSEKLEQTTLGKVFHRTNLPTSKMPSWTVLGMCAKTLVCVH